MRFHAQSRRRAAITSLGALLAGGTATAAIAAANPSLAREAVAAVQTVTCATTGGSPCLSGVNTSSGVGVLGSSKTGTALRGESVSQYGLKATSGSGTAILAQTSSGPFAVTASAASEYGIGVDGESPNGLGVRGIGGQGVAGFTGAGIGTYGDSSSGGYGVMGITDSNGTSGVGVAGYANSYGVGTYGQSTYGIGVEGALSNVGIRGSGTNDGVSASGTYIGVLTDSATFPIIATSGGSNVFWVNSRGDLYYTGSLHPLASVTGGAAVTSFTPTSAQPTAEDTGTAQLVAGAAVVRLDPTFAASIDRTSAYRVFVTPNGDTRGLFVAAKTPNGFIVRESQGGRSTVTFDYRIVAIVAGKAGQRMSAESTADFEPAKSRIAAFLRTTQLHVPKLPQAPRALP